MHRVTFHQLTKGTKHKSTLKWVMFFHDSDSRLGIFLINMNNVRATVGAAIPVSTGSFPNLQYYKSCNIINIIVKLFTQ